MSRNSRNKKTGTPPSKYNIYISQITSFTLLLLASCPRLPTLPPDTSSGVPALAKNFQAKKFFQSAAVLSVTTPPHDLHRYPNPDIKFFSAKPFINKFYCTALPDSLVPVCKSRSSLASPYLEHQINKKYLTATQTRASALFSTMIPTGAPHV